ncbi:MAG: 2-isopropylmalate synthase [Planctomycetota bacterium]|nr:2-isopropylmalate synthase [Planctomycetota bacterium]
MERLKIFDTTLRDGEQAPGFSMQIAEKLQLAKSLAALGVDVLEAGFPAASPDDHAAVQTVAENVKGPVIAGLARCLDADIDAAWDALQYAARPRIHVFLATSAIHREHKLKMAKQEILARTRAGVARARSYCEDVEFSPEDASRTEREFLREVIEAAIESGATTINVPDTVGYTVPHEFEDLFRWLSSNVQGIDQVTLSVHCHDDLGLAVSNSLAAIRGGARQVECTINGIGERAGNSSLEELVMVLATRGEEFGVTTGIDTTRLVPTSRLLSTITGVAVPPNKAIVGRNAFAHEAGIHQHGMLSHASTYEIMTPDSVGFDGDRFVLGKHSGRHALRDRIASLGHELDQDAFDRLFVAFKELADRKQEILDPDLEVLVLSIGTRVAGPWSLLSLHTSAGTDRLATATVSLSHENGERIDEAATGDGPIDAIFRALVRATGHRGAHLEDYQVRSVTLGEDAQGQVTVVCRRGDRAFRGSGYSTDIVEASAQGVLEVINQWERLEQPIPGSPAMAEASR